MKWGRFKARRLMQQAGVSVETRLNGSVERPPIVVMGIG